MIIMRKIYMITLEEDNPLSLVNPGVVKEVAFLLYCELCKFDKPILCANRKNDEELIENVLYEKNIDNKYIYKFISDKDNDNYYLYEPFMINENSFGITVFPDSIDDADIELLIGNILRLVGYNYKYKIDFAYYDEEKKDARYNLVNLLSRKESSTINNKYTKKLNVKIPFFALIK